jgi:hypothetical protein
MDNLAKLKRYRVVLQIIGIKGFHYYIYYYILKVITTFMKTLAHTT